MRTIISYGPSTQRTAELLHEVLTSKGHHNLTPAPYCPRRDGSLGAYAAAGYEAMADAEVVIAVVMSETDHAVTGPTIGAAIALGKEVLVWDLIATEPDRRGVTRNALTRLESVWHLNAAESPASYNRIADLLGLVALKVKAAAGERLMNADWHAVGDTFMGAYGYFNHRLDGAIARAESADAMVREQRLGAARAQAESQALKVELAKRDAGAMNPDRQALLDLCMPLAALARIDITRPGVSLEAIAREVIDDLTRKVAVSPTDLEPCADKEADQAIADEVLRADRALHAAVAAEADLDRVLAEWKQAIGDVRDLIQGGSVVMASTVLNHFERVYTRVAEPLVQALERIIPAGKVPSSVCPVEAAVKSAPYPAALEASKEVKESALHAGEPAQEVV